MNTSTLKIGKGEERTFPHLLRAHALRALPRMWDPPSGLFVFRLRRTPGGIVREGLSFRYTAITLIGLSGETPGTAREAAGGNAPQDVFRGMRDRVGEARNLGDVALLLWAGHSLGEGVDGKVLGRLLDLDPAGAPHPTVEVAWSLEALTRCGSEEHRPLRDRLARRLTEAFDPAAAVFPHLLPPGRGGMRSHVACFADQVYPIEALALHAAAGGGREALAAANGCAARICREQGPAGQWWWHYDHRTGSVVEGYPVYAIHQDAMAPMALFHLAESGGDDHSAAVRKGLEWLARSPELGGGTLLDAEADLVWRKVARKEPGKLSRYAQAAASRLHPSARVPAADLLFPPGAIDHEDRPYHLGWILHAWPERRARAWADGKGGSR